MKRTHKCIQQTNRTEQILRMLYRVTFLFNEKDKHYIGIGCGSSIADLVEGTFCALFRDIISLLKKLIILKTLNAL